MSKRAFYNGDVDGILLPAIDATVFVETDSDSRCGHVERFTLTELSFGFENTPNKITSPSLPRRHEGRVDSFFSTCFEDTTVSDMTTCRLGLGAVLHQLWLVRCCQRAVKGEHRGCWTALCSSGSLLRATSTSICASISARAGGIQPSKRSPRTLKDVAP